MDDVADHARARWNDLVRTLVSLGASSVDAERAAETALAGTWTAWRRERREGDVDVLVYAALLRARPADLQPDPQPGRPPVAAQVLMAGAGLSAYQAEQVLGTPVDEPAHAVAPLVGEQWDDLYRGRAPIEAIERTVSRRRRRARLAVTAGLVVVAVVAVVAWAVQRDDVPTPPPTPDPAVRSNPIALAWWTDGTLHLGTRTVAVPRLRTLAQAGTGTDYPVVVGDRGGAVSQVDADGTVTALGHQTPGAGLVGSPDEGLAAWVDPGDGGAPRLIVWDTAAHQVAGALTLDHAGSAPTSIEGRDVFLTGPLTGTLRWTLGDAAAVPVDVVPIGVGGVKQGRSDTDGRLTASWKPGRVGVELASRALSDPEPPQPDLPPGEYVSDARFDPDGTLVVAAVRFYLISIGSPRSDDGGGGRTAQTDLFTCHTDTGACDLAAGRVASGLSARPLVLAD